MATGTIPKYMDGTDTGWISVTNPDVYLGTIKWRKVGEFAEVKNSGWIRLACNENQEPTVTIAPGSSLILATLDGFDQVMPGYAIVRQSQAKAFLCPTWIENNYLRLYNTTDFTIQYPYTIMVVLLTLKY